MISWRCLAVKARRKGLPKPSTVIWNLVLKPPRLRPKACCSCPPSHFPCPGHSQNAQTYAPTLHYHTSEQSDYRHYFSTHILPVAVAIAHHFDLPIRLLRQSIGTFARSQHRRADQLSENSAPLSTVHRSIAQLSCDNLNLPSSNDNTT